MPTATQSGPRKTGGDFLRADALPTSLKQADADSPDDFAKLPKKEQIEWATWAGQYKQEFIQYFYLVSGLPEDAPYTLTLNSDAKQLIIDRSYEQRIADNFGEGTPSGRQYNGQLDTQMAAKYMMAFTIDDAAGIQHINKFIGELLTDSGNDNQAVNAGQQAGTGLFDTSATIDKAQDFTATSDRMTIDGESIPCFRVAYTDSTGRTSFIIGAYSTTDYQGRPTVVAVVSEG